MPQRVQKMISFTPEEIVNLNAVCKDTGLKKSEVIRQLIAKAAGDKYCRELITKRDYEEKLMKAGLKALGTTSHNVQCEEQEEKDAGDHSPASADSTINQPDYSDWRTNMQSAIALVHDPRARWADE